MTTSKQHFLPRKAPEIFGARRPGQTVEIKLDRTGTRTAAAYMGSGRFTTAYRSGSGSEVYLYTFYNDFSKSILAHAYREYGISNRHLAKIVRVGQLTYKGQPVNVYKAKYYDKVIRKYLSPENLRVINILQDAHDEACHKFPNNIVQGCKGHEFNQVILDAKGLPNSMRLALEHLAYVSLDWGDHYIFDNFHTRNLGLNARKQLVLIDPLFDFEKIQKDHAYRRKSGRTWA